MPSLPAAFAFYGTLRRDGRALDRLGIRDAVTWLGPCLIPGRLFRVSWYPALVRGGGTVVGDLFAVPDLEAVEVIDRFEGSGYDRVEMRLAEPDLVAWTYLWNGPTDDLDPIEGGDWLAVER